MKIIKNLIRLIKDKKIKLIIKKFIVKIQKFIYLIRAQIEDRKYGGISVEKAKASRFRELGAKSTESTNYIWLDKIFRSYPLKKDDVFVDIGCGEGRVLTYLYSRKFRGELIGVELDADVAAIARSRTEKCSNINIYSGNFLDYNDMISRCTAIYLFNPFEEDILKTLVEMIETYIDHPLTVYYCNDLYRRVLDKRKRWIILRRDTLNISILPKRSFTVYQYHPPKQQCS